MLPPEAEAGLGDSVSAGHSVPAGCLESFLGVVGPSLFFLLHDTPHKIVGRMAVLVTMGALSGAINGTVSKWRLWST